MTAEGNDVSDELREAIVAALAERLNPRTGMSERAVDRLADAVLALPEVAALRAKAAAADRVRKLAEELDGEDEWNEMAPSTAADRIRAALDQPKPAAAR